MRCRLGLFASVVVATGALASGCGGDKAGGAGTTGVDGADGARGRIGDVEFAEEAQAICARRVATTAGQMRRHIEQNLGQGKSEAQLEAESIATIFVPGIEAEIGELRELEPAAEDEDKVESFLTAMEEAVEKTKRTEHSAAQFEEFGREYLRAGRLAQRYGLEGCSLTS